MEEININPLNLDPNIFTYVGTNYSTNYSTAYTCPDNYYESPEYQKSLEAAIQAFKNAPAYYAPVSYDYSPPKPKILKTHNHPLTKMFL